MATTTEGLQHLLDKEIEALNAEETKGGFSVWVILAALAAIGLFAADVWSAGPLQLDTYLKSSVAFGFGLLIVVSVMWESSDAIPHAVGSGRWRASTDALAQKRPLFIVLFLLYVVLATMSWVGRTGVAWWGVTLAVLLLAFLIAIIVLAAIVAYREMYLAAFEPSIEEPKWNLVGAFIFVLPQVAVIVAYLRALDFPPPGSPLREFTLAGLTTAAGLLVAVLATRGRRHPALSELQRIRRDLDLGSVDAQAAKKAVEIALLGLDSTARTERELQKARRLYLELHESWIAQVDSRLSALEQKSWQAKPTDDMELVLELAEELRTDGKAAEKQIERIAQLLADLGPAITSREEEVSAVARSLHAELAIAVNAAQRQLTESMARTAEVERRSRESSK